jgi:hypothetical protein
MEVKGDYAARDAADNACVKRPAVPYKKYLYDLNY